MTHPNPWPWEAVVLCPTFAPHDQLVKEIRHQVAALARGSHCNRKTMGDGGERDQCETCSWVTTSGFSHICPLFLHD